MNIKIIDLNRYPRADLPFITQGSTFYTQEMIDSMENTLKNGESVLIFHNRKASFRKVICENCGNKVVCPSCNFPMTFFKNSNICECSFCKITRSLKPCETCGHEIYDFQGIGTEKLEDDMKKIFEGYKIIRFDSTTSNEIETDFKSDSEPTIYIGTSMVSKGHDFSNLSLVVVLNFDQMFSMPGFRSVEKSINTLIQVSGRAGRRGQEKSIIFQTFNPDNIFLKFIKEENYEKFLEYEISERKKFGYPPFGNFVLLSLREKNKEVGLKKQEQVFSSLRQFGFKDVYTPVPYREFYHGKYTFLILIKGVKKNILKQYYNTNKEIHDWKFDLEPSDIFEGID